MGRARFRRAASVVLCVSLASVTASAGVAAAAPLAQVECRGTLTGEDEAIVVPKQAACTLSGAHVLGEVVIGRKGELRTGKDAGRSTVIDGSVIAHRARSVLLQYEAQVGGDFRVLHPTARPHRDGFDIGVSISGDAIIADTTGYTFVDSAHVGGDLRVRGTFGGLEIEWNTVDGDVAITHNSPVEVASVYQNNVGKSMSVTYTTGSTSKWVHENSVSNVLRRRVNDRPFVGSPNQAQRLRGQCGAAT